MLRTRGCLWGAIVLVVVGALVCGAFLLLRDAPDPEEARRLDAVGAEEFLRWSPPGTTETTRVETVGERPTNLDGARITDHGSVVTTRFVTTAKTAMVVTRWIDAAKRNGYAIYSVVCKDGTWDVTAEKAFGDSGFEAFLQAPADDGTVRFQLAMPHHAQDTKPGHVPPVPNQAHRDCLASLG